MLLGILDLNKVTVDDVMIPRHQIIGINLEQPWEKIAKQIAKSEFEWIPIYRENINQVLGILHVRDLMAITLMSSLNKEILLKLLVEPYFIPQGTLLNVQLQNFQKTQQRMALVVDEYGEIQGLLTLKDILEEIVGEFTSSVSSAVKLIQLQSDGSYLIDGAVTIREMNRVTRWNLPTRGSRTLNGLIIEQSDSSHWNLCLIVNHPIKYSSEDNAKTALVFPCLSQIEPSE